MPKEGGGASTGLLYLNATAHNTRDKEKAALLPDKAGSRDKKADEMKTEGNRRHIAKLPSARDLTVFGHY